MAGTLMSMFLPFLAEAHCSAENEVFISRVHFCPENNLKCCLYGVHFIVNAGRSLFL
jgi:hypothetical protein